MIASTTIYRRIKLTNTLSCIFAIMYSVTCYSQTEHEVQQVQEFLTSKDNIGLNAIPSFYNRDSTQGFQYFSRRWLRGVVIYANDQTTQGQITLRVNDSFFYNFDKFNNKLVSTQDGKNVLTLSNEAVSKFILVDSAKAYLFKKIPVISRTIYFQPIIENDSGYSLYRHTITKYSHADYQNIGYGGTGKKYDEYTDSYEYSIVWPEEKEFKKTSLNVSSVKKALKDESASVDEFFQQ